MVNVGKYTSHMDPMGFGIPLFNDVFFFMFEDLEQSEKPVIIPGSSRICKMSAVGRFFG